MVQSSATATSSPCAVICLCYGSWFISNWFVQYAFIIAPCCWFGLAAIRYYDSGQLFLYLSEILSVVLIYTHKIIQQYFRQPRICVCDDTICEVLNPYGMPCPETLYLFGLCAYLIVSDLMFGTLRRNWFRNTNFCAIILVVSLSLWVNGNYDIPQIVVGMVAGIGCAVPLAVFSFYYFRETMPWILETSWIPQWFNLHDDLFLLNHHHHRRRRRSSHHHDRSLSLHTRGDILDASMDDKSDQESLAWEQQQHFERIIRSLFIESPLCNMNELKL